MKLGALEAYCTRVDVEVGGDVELWRSGGQRRRFRFCLQAGADMVRLEGFSLSPTTSSLKGLSVSPITSRFVVVRYRRQGSGRAVDSRSFRRVW